MRQLPNDLIHHCNQIPNSTSVVSHKRLELFSLVFAYSRPSAAGLDYFERLFAPAKFSDDRFDGGGPYEGLRIGVPTREKLFDRSLQILDADKNAASDALAG